MSNEGPSRALICKKNGASAESNREMFPERLLAAFLQDRSSHVRGSTHWFRGHQLWPNEVWPSCFTKLLRGRRGFTRQPENSKRAHLSARALRTRRPPREEEKNEFFGGTGEKARNFGPPFRTPTLRGPTFLHPSTSTQNTKKNLNNQFQKNPNNLLPKTKIFTQLKP